MTCEPCAKPPYSHSRAILLKRRREHEVRGLELRAYYCPECGKWHLTKKADRFGRRDAA